MGLYPAGICISAEVPLIFVSTFGDLTVFDNAANLPARDNFPIN
jgi:hypothetical protein